MSTPDILPHGNFEDFAKEWKAPRDDAETQEISELPHSQSEQKDNKKFKFTIGDRVRIQRSSGVVEDDWEVSRFLDDGMTRVIQPERGVEKIIPWSQLVSLNPEAVVPEIGDVEQFQPGKRVNVQRTSGEVENDWEVSQIMPDGRIRVIQPEKHLQKFVPRELLAIWNPQE